MEIAHQKCKRHASREAVARCLECKGFFCRECVTEHDDRIICADCLLKLSGPAGKKSHPFRWIFRGAWAFIGFFVLWLSFYYLGRFLLSLPSDFHEGTMWTETTSKGADE